MAKLFMFWGFRHTKFYTNPFTDIHFPSLAQPVFMTGIFYNLALWLTVMLEIGYYA